MSSSNTIAEFTILGEPCSKANSRQLVKFGVRMVSIKSKKALAYVKDFRLQCPQLEPPISTDVSVTITIYYASRRPDLDESLILDCMQSEVNTCKQTKIKTIVRNNIYLNDRQVKEKHIFHQLDRDNPRAEITISGVG